MDSVVPRTSGRRDLTITHSFYARLITTASATSNTVPALWRQRVCCRNQHTEVPTNQPLALEAASRPTSQDISSLWWICNVHRQVYKSVPLVYTPTTTVRFTHSSLFLKNTGEYHSSIYDLVLIDVSFCFPDHNVVLISVPLVHDTCSNHLSLLNPVNLSWTIHVINLHITQLISSCSHSVPLSTQQCPTRSISCHVNTYIFLGRILRILGIKEKPVLLKANP
jgi:hypothetical protein